MNDYKNWHNCSCTKIVLVNNYPEKKISIFYVFIIFIDGSTFTSPKHLWKSKIFQESRRFSSGKVFKRFRFRRQRHEEFVSLRHTSVWNWCKKLPWSKICRNRNVHYHGKGEYFLLILLNCTSGATKN